jgi:hypothetical protein
MVRDSVLQLRYLGVRPQEGNTEYGFQIENSDKSSRLVVLMIEGDIFAKNSLMLQEAPDLCYQKVLLDLSNETAEVRMPSYVPITASDVAHYRELHPTVKPRKHFQNKVVTE